MSKNDILLWKEYRLGKLNTEITLEEKEKFELYEKIMENILPTNDFLDYYNMLLKQGWNDTQILNILCMTYRVPAPMVEMKLYDIKNNIFKETMDSKQNSDVRKYIKARGNLSFWKVYKMGNLNRELYPLEESRILEIDNAMNTLVPDEIFTSLYDFLLESEESKQRIITMLSIRFKVPTDIIEVKIYEYEKSRNNEINGPKLVK